MRESWRQVSIAKDVGSSENTVLEVAQLLDAKNALLPVTQRFGNNEKGEKLLRCIAAASRLFAETATDELNAVEGVPGQPGVRRFQGAAPPPRPRDVDALVAHYHLQWRTHFRNGTITAAAATKLRSPSNQSVHRGLAASIDVSQPAAAGTLIADMPSASGRSVSPTSTLGAITEAGLSLQRGTPPHLTLTWHHRTS